MPWGSFGTLWGALGLLLSLLGAPFGLLWNALGRHWDALGHTLGHLGLHWGVLGMPWDHFGTPWARCWDASGSFWAILDIWCPQEPPPQADGSQVPRLRTKTSLLEFARRSYGSRRNGPRTTVQDLPSTRAGDQDDVSFTNSLKLFIFEALNFGRIEIVDMAISF